MDHDRTKPPSALSGLSLPVLAAMVTVIVALFIGGCSDIPEPDKGANQSLVEIGEHSLEEAERLEMQGKRGEASAAYNRSLWAFRYHEQLTGEEPFLLEEALDGIKRTGGRGRR